MTTQTPADAGIGRADGARFSPFRVRASIRSITRDELTKLLQEWNTIPNIAHSTLVSVGPVDGNASRPEAELRGKRTAASTRNLLVDFGRRMLDRTASIVCDYDHTDQLEAVITVQLPHGPQSDAAFEQPLTAVIDHLAEHGFIGHACEVDGRRVTIRAHGDDEPADLTDRILALAGYEHRGWPEVAVRLQSVLPVTTGS